MSKAAEAVKVVVRCRPFNARETDMKCGRCLFMDTSLGQVTLTNPNAPQDPPKTFTFDCVYDMDSAQKAVYQETAKPIVDSVLAGYNGTVFAYGQTGAGKTFTMEGKGENAGLIPNAFQQIFNTISETKESMQFLVRASYLEIYNEEIRDLLAKDSKARLELKESADKGVYVKDLTSFVVKSVDEIDSVMAAGKKNRTVGATAMNFESSRSHSIFMITIESSEPGVGGKDHIRAGRLNMVDLAGSERAMKTGATGERLKEGCKINLSLSALGNVITALVDGKSKHVPYRDSKLTRLLQDSLGGNTKTVMVANCSPADNNYDETLSTLRYANRAKSIQNKPIINEDPKDAMIREFQEEIQRLKAKLEQAASSGGLGGPSIISEEEMMLREKKLEEIREKERKLEEEKDALKKEMEAKSEEEKKKLLEQQQKIEEERLRMEEELRIRREELERERMAREALMAKLKAMEAHVVHGAGTQDLSAALSVPLNNAVLQEKEMLLKDREQEIERRKQEEARLRQELEEREEARLLVEEQYSSLQEEVDAKTKKLKRLFAKYKEVKSENSDMQHEFQQEREDFLFTIRQLERELKLKTLIIDNFIPPEETKKIVSRSIWDENEDQWKIAHLSLAGNNTRTKRPQSAVGNRRPVSGYARQHSSANPRYKAENIINVGLDMPERTTKDYEGPNSMGPQFNFLHEYEMTFTASENLPNVYLSYDPSMGRNGTGSHSADGAPAPVAASSPTSVKEKSVRSRQSSRASASSSSSAGRRRSRRLDGTTSQSLPEEYYPSARGLVGDQKRFL